LYSRQQLNHQFVCLACEGKMTPTLQLLPRRGLGQLAVAAGALPLRSHLPQPRGKAEDPPYWTCLSLSVSLSMSLSPSICLALSPSLYPLGREYQVNLLLGRARIFVYQIKYIFVRAAIFWPIESSAQTTRIAPGQGNTRRGSFGGPTR